MLAILSFARLAMGFQFQSIGALSAFVGSDLRLDSSSLGILIGIYMLPGVIVALPGGILGARFGDKRILVAGLCLMFVGGIISAMTSSYPSNMSSTA